MCDTSRTTLPRHATCIYSWSQPTEACVSLVVAKVNVVGCCFWAKKERLCWVLLAVFKPSIPRFTRFLACLLLNANFNTQRLNRKQMNIGLVAGNRRCMCSWPFTLHFFIDVSVVVLCTPVACCIVSSCVVRSCLRRMLYSVLLAVKRIKVGATAVGVLPGLAAHNWLGCGNSAWLVHLNVTIFRFVLQSL